MKGNLSDSGRGDVKGPGKASLSNAPKRENRYVDIPQPVFSPPSW